MGQISSHLLRKAFATWQHAFLFTSTIFCDIFALVRAEMKSLRFLDEKVTFLFDIVFHFLCFSFFSFSYLFAAEIDLVLGLLPVQKILRKHHQEGQILQWSCHA